ANHHAASLRMTRPYVLDMIKRSKFFAFVLAASAEPAQTPQPANSARDRGRLFTRTDAMLAAGFIGLTVAMRPADRSIAVRLQDSTTQANDFLKNASRNIQYLADPGSVVIGVSMYVVGRVGH